MSIIPTRIIKKAREGSWSPIVLVFNDSAIPIEAPWQIHALDPLFWRALGKALGWKDEDKCPVCWQKIAPQGTSWMCHAHRFYDLILTGGSTDEFWEEILPSV